MKQAYDTIRPIIWKDDALHLLDQRRLPQSEEWLTLTTLTAVTNAIRDMVVRGAPAIGITAAFGVVIAARVRYEQDPSCWRQWVEDDLKLLSQSRPTAVNLFWAIKRMSALFDAIGGNPVPVLLAEAQAIHDEDIEANYRMGQLGADVLGDSSAVLTHCNAGALATGGYGTALGVIRAAWERGGLQRVYADETRPWLQGARLTAWEMVHERIPVTLLADSAAAHLMRQSKVQWIVVGSDRIAGNGDVANKIGTYSLAILARHHGVKFMVVAPTSTIDMSLPHGDEIPIEQRASDEVLQAAGQVIAATGAEAWNPAFDMTPATLVDVIVTEKGVVERPDAEKMKALMLS
ncbi:MAG: S-methyl-5-thioribose-1-phosphate isomerase [Gammaproteobacteria bacterium]|nr:S-methyl-5-thioribose-1-phosphate isomerase [Gammaproteobacteria bacterium]